MGSSRVMEAALPIRVDGHGLWPLSEEHKPTPRFVVSLSNHGGQNQHPPPSFDRLRTNRSGHVPPLHQVRGTGTGSRGAAGGRLEALVRGDQLPRFVVSLSNHGGQSQPWPPSFDTLRTNHLKHPPGVASAEDWDDQLSSGRRGSSGSHSIRLIITPSGSRNTISRCLDRPSTTSGTGGDRMVSPRAFSRSCTGSRSAQ